MSKSVNFFNLILLLQFLQFSIQLRVISDEKSQDYLYNDDDEEFTMLISGGFVADSSAKFIKYMVSIRTAQPTAYFGDNHYCAGVIVAPRAVITAAHCVVDARGVKTRPRRINVVAGTPSRLRRTKNTVEVGVEKVIPHEDYVRRERNDIAVLRLKSALPDTNPLIRIIILPRNFAIPGKRCEVIGWGQLFYMGPYSNMAVQLNLRIFKDSECHAAYPRFYGEGMICAGDKRDWEKSVCRGDSGSPLICGGLLHGIVSWSDTCGKKDHPSVFTDVAYYRNWIMQVSGTVAVRSVFLFEYGASLILGIIIRKFWIYF